jgi:hypothetical protein
VNIKSNPNQVQPVKPVKDNVTPALLASMPVAGMVVDKFEKAVRK